MPRAIAVLPAAERDSKPISDTLLLSHEQRASPHGDFVALRGTKVEIVIREAPRLRTDDRLLLDDGRVVEIVARPEKLIEVRAADVTELARLAWILGDRHIPVEVSERRLRVRYDAATEKLLRAQGARITSIEAPFEPEGGAYAPSNQGHAHGHDHAHSRPHSHHSHRHPHES